MDWERHVITIQLDELQVSDCVALPHVISLSLVYQVGQANETPNNYTYTKWPSTEL